MGIFSLVPRVISPVTSQLTTVFLMHFVWFTNWKGETFWQKMGWVNPSRAPRLLHYWSRNMVNPDLIDKSLGIVFPAHFAYDFSTKMFFILYSINWPNFIVVTFTSWDIGQYVYCNCLLTRLWRQKFQNQCHLSNQTASIHA